MENIILEQHKDQLETELFWLEMTDHFNSVQWEKFNSLHAQIRNINDLLKGAMA